MRSSDQGTPELASRECGARKMRHDLNIQSSRATWQSIVLENRERVVLCLRRNASLPGAGPDPALADELGRPSYHAPTIITFS